ncbi:MAG: MBL fold metallo-hydrolase [Proteobacteria bacterium]|nr:MBL fold metallo-hydrolase [Pseudomonadota bacterium]
MHLSPQTGQQELQGHDVTLGRDESGRTRISFLGASGTVTGSRYLVEAGGHKILVDCGLFQGYKPLRLRNWAPFPVSPSGIDAVVLTHAHLDHSGYLPALVRDGFRGPVFCSEGTRELAEILLPDSGRLQEEEAQYANRKRFSKHHPALPLYSEDDAKNALKRFRAIEFGKSFDLAPGVQVQLYPAGHMVGASCIRLSCKDGTVLFSGDIGRPNDAILSAPTTGLEADYLVVESTYGDRVHSSEDAEAALAEVINRTAARGGIVVVPSFAVGRAQALMYFMWRLKSSGRIPDLPVFLNSPMATDATAVYHRHRAEHRLSPEQCKGMCTVAKIVRSVEESRALNRIRHPAVIISASGMATGGRVLHHLKAFAPDPKNTILFAGYQAGGTRGARLVAGEREIRIHGEDVRVRAEVLNIDSLSAHADAGEIISWLRTFGRPPRRTFVTHGEPTASDALRRRIEREFGWEADIPEHLQCVELDGGETGAKDAT